MYNAMNAETNVKLLALITTQVHFMRWNIHHLHVVLSVLTCS